MKEKYVMPPVIMLPNMVIATAMFFLFLSICGLEKTPSNIMRKNPEKKKMNAKNVIRMPMMRDMLINILISRGG